MSPSPELDPNPGGAPAPPEDPAGRGAAGDGASGSGDSRPPRISRTFFTIWVGQVVSLLGTGLTGFALGVWVYQETGSVTQFSLILFFTSLPGLVVSPLAGALIDRWDRRLTMIAANAMGLASALGLALLFWTGHLEIWHIYGLMALASLGTAFQYPAFLASITVLVPKARFGQASGMAQMGMALGQTISPVVGGALLVSIGVRGVLIIDCITFTVAILTLLVVRIPPPPQSAETSERRGNLWKEAWYGWTYLRQRPGLWALLLLFFVTNFALGMVQALLTPLVLSFTTAPVLGVVLSVAGAGMVLGTVVMAVWGGPTLKMRGIFWALLGEGIVLMVGGIRESAVLISLAAFLYLLLLPVVTACSQAIWQAKVAPDVQGRVFAIRRMVAFSSLPIAYTLAGPLADRVFEPLMVPGAALAQVFGPLFGVGEGRGIGLLFSLLGVAVVLYQLLAFRNPRLAKVEEELPDAVDDDLAVATGDGMKGDGMDGDGMEEDGAMGPVTP